MADVIRQIAGAFTALLLFACTATPPAEPPVRVLDNADTVGTALDFGPRGERLVLGDASGAISVWNAATGRHIRRWEAHGHAVSGVAFAGPHRLVSGGYDGTLALWDGRGRLLHRQHVGSAVTALVVDRRREQVITGHGDGAVRTWRLAGLALVETRALHDGGIRAVARHVPSGLTASSGKDGNVFLWRKEDRPQRLARPPYDAHTLVFSADGRQLHGGGFLRLFRWTLADGQLQTVSTEHRGIIKGLDRLPGAPALASISRQTDSSVYVLDPGTGATLHRFEAHDLCGAALRVSPRGDYLATTGDDGVVKLWRLESQGAGNR